MAFLKTIISNCIIDHWNVTSDVTSDYSSVIPTEWDLLTIMDANFNGNLTADNLGAELLSIDGFKVKRRKMDEFDWKTIGFVPVSKAVDYSFIFQDNLAANGVEYEYAFVPVKNNIEGNYISDTIKSKFNGVFICDADTIYKFYSNVSYGNTQRVQKIGIFEPFGSKYPVFVSNGLTNYENGSLKGNVLPNNFYDTHQLDREAIVKENKILKDFLTNKKAKIIKDFNGNYWLVMVTGNPTVAYDKNSTMGLININFSWTEVGDPNNQEDLYSSGIVEER